MKNKIILRITGIGVLIAFVWMISSANMIYPQNSIDELEWAKKFFKAGSYQEAAELLKVFISKHKKSEPERLEEFSEAYYLLSKKKSNGVSESNLIPAPPNLPLGSIKQK